MPVTVPAASVPAAFVPATSVLAALAASVLAVSVSAFFMLCVAASIAWVMAAWFLVLDMWKA